MTHRAPLLFRWRHLAARCVFVLLAATALAATVPALAQDADPPGRVAYLNHRQGTLSVSPSGDNSWYESEPNRPLVQGDRLWTDRNARAELFVGDIAVRMDEQTQLEISELDDQTLRLTLQQGRAQLRLRGDAGGTQGRVELGTGNVAVVMRAPGDYRVQADPQADTTQVMVAHGNATVYGDGGQSQDLGNRQQATYTGRDLTAGGPPQPLPPAFDHWVAERNRAEDQSQSARYMSREIPGYMQLDQYGQWQNDPDYGAVWYPSNVASDWSPYSDGYWAVVAPWGYTWIDRAPWGFAPFHYGRWTRIGPRWCWVPGHRHERPVYSPALVAFMGGAGTSLVVQGGRPAVGWFPLAPGDRWRPPYRASERYVELANRPVVGGVRPAPAYANRALPNAVVAVPVERFGRGGPIDRRDFVRPAAPIVAAAQPSARPPMAWPTANIPGRGAGPDANTAYFGRRTQAAPPPVAAISPPQQPGRFQRDRDEFRPGRDDSLRQQQQQQRVEQQQQQAARQHERQQQMEQQRQQQEGSRQAQQEQARQQREAAQQQQQQARQQMLDQQQQQRQQRQDPQWMQRQQAEQRSQQDMQQRAAQAQQAQQQAEQQQMRQQQQLEQQQRQQQQMQVQQRQQQVEQQRQQQEQQRIQQQQAQATQRAQQEQAQAAQRAQQEQARQQAQMQRQQQQEQQQQRMQMEQQRMQQEQQRQQQQQQQMQAQQRQQQMEQQRQQQEQQQRMQQMQQQQAAQRAQQEQAQRQMQMHQQQMEQQRQMQMEQQRQMQMQQRQAEQMARQQQEMQQRAQQQAQQQAQRAQQQQQQQMHQQQMQGGNRGRGGGPGDDNQRP